MKASKALDIIDEVIKTIRATKADEDPKLKLMEKFGFTDLQSQAILDMQLRKLSGLERQKLTKNTKISNKPLPISPLLSLSLKK